MQLIICVFIFIHSFTHQCSYSWKYEALNIIVRLNILGYLKHDQPSVNSHQTPRIKLEPSVCPNHIWIHIQKWMREWRFFYIFNAVSAALTSVLICFNENVFFFTFFLTEELPASREWRGASKCDVSSFCKDEDFCTDENSVSALQCCWKDEQSIQSSFCKRVNEATADVK